MLVGLKMNEEDDIAKEMILEIYHNQLVWLPDSRSAFVQNSGNITSANHFPSPSDLRGC